MGRTSHSRRAAQARLRGRRVDGVQVHGQTSWAPSQGWRTFLRNHADVIAAIDLCLVPTVKFECLFAFRDALSQALRRATGSSRRHDARRDLKLPRPLYLVVRLRSGRSKRTYDLTSSIVPRGTASIRSRHKAGRPCCCIWRTPSSRSSSIVRELLQSSSNALIAEQGCAGNPFHRNRWPHSGRANPGRIAPSGQAAANDRGLTFAAIVFVWNP